MMHHRLQLADVSIYTGGYQWRVDGDDHSAAVGLMVGARGRGVVLLLGVGWDDEMPLRPWPALSTKPSPGGRRGFCVSWCGLFAQVRVREG